METILEMFRRVLLETILFNEADVPLPLNIHVSRRSFIEESRRISEEHVGHVGNGGNMSARSNEHGGSERRRRQSESRIDGGGNGTDSSAKNGAGRTKRHVFYEGLGCILMGKGHSLIGDS